MTTAVARMVDRLIAAGMGPEAATAKGDLLARASGALNDAATLAWYVPGRIEFLGKHTDYAGGRSLLCTVERGICMLARPRADATIRLVATQTGETASFELDPTLTPAVGHWTNYPMTVAARVAANFPGPLRGADIAFASDLPLAAGMSSSSALVVATFLTLSDVNDLPSRVEYQQSIQTFEDLAGYLGTVENGQSFGPLVGSRGVGTFGGSEDHTAILCSTAGKLTQYAFKPVRREADVALPDGYALVIASSGVVAEKTRAAKEKYNRVSRTAAVILEQWHAAGGTGGCLAEALRSEPGAFERMNAILRTASSDSFTPAELTARVQQFRTESERLIPGAVSALRGGSLEELGRLIDTSQSEAAGALGNQTPETEFLATAARRCGAVAATAFGAGFGGSVWAMVATGSVPDFTASWSAAYAAEFPEAAARSNFFKTRAGPPALRL